MKHSAELLYTMYHFDYVTLETNNYNVAEGMIRNYVKEKLTDIELEELTTLIWNRCVEFEGIGEIFDMDCEECGDRIEYCECEKPWKLIKK